MPKTDSIRELARFWDTHDLTDFEDQMEEVAAPVFVAGRVIQVRLEPPEAETVREIARTKGIAEEDLIRTWVLERVRSR